MLSDVYFTLMCYSFSVFMSVLATLLSEKSCGISYKYNLLMYNTSKQFNIFLLFFFYVLCIIFWVLNWCIVKDVMQILKV